MKIIDNKKDYYDYLSGILGIDNQRVYDRRGSVIPSIGLSDYSNWKNGNIDLQYHLWIGLEYRIISYDRTTGSWVCGYPDQYTRPYKRKSTAPIELIISSTRRVGGKWHFVNPILRDLSIVRKHISERFIWNEVYNYLGWLKEMPVIDTRTDAQKIESHGFDKKTSFRNVK